MLGGQRLGIAVALLGSEVRGETPAYSDYDFLVVVRHKQQG